jgi:hypothetical protein
MHRETHGNNERWADRTKVEAPADNSAGKIERLVFRTLSIPPLRPIYSMSVELADAGKYLEEEH